MVAQKQRVLSNRVSRAAERHLSQSCKVMARLVATHGPCVLAAREFRFFQALATAIISQQLSAKAAETIKQRVFEIVPKFSPSGFLSISDTSFRHAGLSTAKTRYIRELSNRINDGLINFEVLIRKPDEEVISALIELPGIGRWTAEMFLIFGLRRPDVLSIGDAGLQRAVRLLFGDDAALDSVGQTWRPYCSVASWYLWQHLDSGQL